MVSLLVGIASFQSDAWGELVQSSSSQFDQIIVLHSLIKSFVELVVSSSSVEIMLQSGSLSTSEVCEE